MLLTHRDVVRQESANGHARVELDGELRCACGRAFGPPTETSRQRWRHHVEDVAIDVLTVELALESPTAVVGDPPRSKVPWRK